MWRVRKPDVCHNCKSNKFHRHTTVEEKEDWCLLLIELEDREDPLRLDLWECETCGVVYLMAQKKHEFSHTNR